MNPLKFFLSLAGIAILIMVVMMIACDKPSQSDIHNRVPTLPQSTADAQKAAQDAQASASRAEEALKSLQAEQEKQKEAAAPTVVYTTDGTPQERTNNGHVVDVTEIWETESETNYGEAYVAFTFAEDGGFTKRFYPVCSDQVIQTGKSTAIMYHWNPNKNSGHHNEKGCFKIDGYQFQKGQ